MKSVLFRIWTGYTDNHRDNQIANFMENYGHIARSNYKLHRTQISSMQNDDVCTIHIGNENKKPLVIVHGYGGTGCMFYKYFNAFVRQFDVYLVDLRGTGLSGRSAIKCSNLKEYEDYFIEGIDAAIKYHNLDKFVLVAHSMGAYYSSLYATKYPEKISRLVLLSPAGFSKVNEAKLNEFMAFINGMKWPFRSIYKKAMNTIIAGNSPFTLFRKFGVFTFAVLKTYKKYIQLPNKAESNDYIKMLYYINVQKECSDRCLGKVISYHGYGLDALESRVKLPENTIILYGEHDWIDYSGAIRYAGAHKSVSFDIIKGAGHNLNIQGVDEILAILQKKGVLNN
jgi:pimeloyl-ACP methyl ester carboxylesterase